MQPELITVTGIHRPVGYSHASRAGNTVYIAGQVATDVEGRLVGGGDFAAQARQAFANLAAVIEHVGGSWANVVKTTVYLTDGRFLDQFRVVRREVMEGHEPPNTLVIAAGLGAPELMVEVEAILVLG